MNNLLKLSAYLCVIFIVSSCTTESFEDSYNENSALKYETIINQAPVNQASASQACADQAPMSRLINNGSLILGFVIIDSNNNIIEELNITPGSTSSWITFNAGHTTFALKNSTTGIIYDRIILETSTCTEVDMFVDASNMLGTPIIQTIN